MSDIKMKIYNHSPIWLQQIFTTIEGYRMKKQRYGSFYDRYLHELKKRDNTDKEKQQQLQNETFVQFVRHAVANSPFYKKYYASIDVNEIHSVRDIKKLPILEKDMVRKYSKQFYTISPKDGVIISTSGTTGKSLNVVYTYEDFQKRLAYLDHFKAQHGFIAGKMKRASFGSRYIIPPKQKKKIFWRDNLAISQRLYSGYYCQGENIPYYVENLNHYKPASIDGYPSALYELACFILDENITLQFTPIAIFTTAETLLPHYKEMIEKAFHCPVRNQYASSEGAPFITECPYGNLHYHLDTGIIETDENGEMIVTCFHTHGTPLIRYKIGDKVKMASEHLICPCGLAHPVVERLEGRSIDYLESPTKGRFTAAYLSLYAGKFLNAVKKMQYIQHDLDEITVLLEVDHTYTSEINKFILEQLHYMFGSEVKIHIKIVDEIPREKSGKYRFIINTLNEKQFSY